MTLVEWLAAILPYWPTHEQEVRDAIAEIERLQAHIMELVRDNKHLRAEIEALQRMRHEEIA